MRDAIARQAGAVSATPSRNMARILTGQRVHPERLDHDAHARLQHRRHRRLPFSAKPVMNKHGESRPAGARRVRQLPPVHAAGKSHVRHQQVHPVPSRRRCAASPAAPSEASSRGVAQVPQDFRHQQTDHRLVVDDQDRLAELGAFRSGLRPVPGDIRAAGHRRSFTRGRNSVTEVPRPSTLWMRTCPPDCLVKP